MNDGEIGLLDYLAVCWGRRWWVVAMTALPMIVAGGLLAARPARYEAEAVLALTPPAFGQRVALMIAWGVAPEGVIQAGNEVRTERKDELLRLAAVGPSARHAQAAVERVLAWIEAERRLPEPEPESASALPSRRKPRTTPQQAAAWQAALGEIEARLPYLLPSAAPYWTQRALTFQARIEAALEPELEPKEPKEPKGEEASVLQTRPARRLPERWSVTLLSAGVSGFVVLGLFGALAEAWWRAEVARRRGEPREGE